KRSSFYLNQCSSFDGAPPDSFILVKQDVAVKSGFLNPPLIGDRLTYLLPHQRGTACSAGAALMNTTWPTALRSAGSNARVIFAVAATLTVNVSNHNAYGVSSTLATSAMPAQC